MSATAHVPIHGNFAHVLVGMDAATLRELASLAEQRDRPRWLNAGTLAAEVAEIVGRGSQPALGLYRRHLVARPEPLVPPTWPDQYRRVLLAMCATDWPFRIAADAVADLALSYGVFDDEVVELVAAALIESSREPA